jgi:hypothetical protein
MNETREHWEKVYTTRAETAVSWYQPVLAKSLELIREAAPDASSSIIDIGGGASTLPDSLLDAGYRDISVLDVSQAALIHSKARLGQRAADLKWIAADITKWSPERTWDVWHDRAVFHFLNEQAAQDRYIAALRGATTKGSKAVISTFALDGPERCSGLPVQRYSAKTLAQRVGTPFELIGEHSERHLTPGGAVQSFMFAVLIRA